jgi:transposase-like protein
MVIATTPSFGAIVADVARRAAVCAGQIYRWRQELGHAGSGFSQVVLAAGGAI